MISIKLSGGIGNQLFQLFAAKYLASMREDELHVIFDSSPKGAYRHGEPISRLEFNFNFVESKSSFENDLRERFEFQVFKKLPDVYLKYQILFKNYKSQVTGYDPVLGELGRNKLVQGYFQTFRYYRSLVTLNPEISLVRPKNKSSQLLNYARMMADVNPVVIHLRRGDYVGNVNTGLLSKEYYFDALDSIGEPTRAVWVFSDDIQNAREELGHTRSRNWRWISHNDLVSPNENLYLMSLTRDMVIGNSTFSYWAASINAPKNILAPKKWFRNQEDPCDLYPPEWKTIQSSWVE